MHTLQAFFVLLSEESNLQLIPKEIEIGMNLNPRNTQLQLNKIWRRTLQTELNQTHPA